MIAPIWAASGSIRSKQLGRSVYFLLLLDASILITTLAILPIRMIKQKR